ncbi:unnamed protein product (macronuclear) [Paramecium tetraurelia]|uniref:Uncharacterized protein n=1 Tax=Paramecium tetraurelia TaxID=5888 RepID=A0BY94_PARTE|nr:uncharacterized protein GSPATT00033364001 [Paramecium tetraurelia]CAK63511.1 unnamed protein product [Paramecium tetraurelia]|eukprot:XP_001430909.1 hypothetical protein (macronuclear) [Paramecium tetraurelia strain d4-2]
MSFFGKVLLLTALVGYSALLISYSSLGKQFDTKYNELLKHKLVTKYIPADTIKLLPPELSKLIIAGLISSSVLMFICRCFVYLPLLGLSLQIVITANPLMNTDSTTSIEFLKLFALVGGLLLWSSSSSSSKKPTKVKPE